MTTLNGLLPQFHAGGIPGRVRPLTRIVAFSVLLLLGAVHAPWVHAQSDSSDSPSREPQQTEAVGPENPLDVDLLLEDPVDDLPPFQEIRTRLQELAAEEGTAEAFQRAAEELAAKGIYATAIQVLWFASKMVTDETVARDYARQMKTWSRAAAPADGLIEEGEQLQVAGRNKEAIEAYLQAIEAYPFNERAHFRLADAWRRVYMEEYGEEHNLAPLEIRVRLFRDAYVHYRLVLEIDPLFYDARYGLSELREMFPDNHELLIKTQPLTQEALDFRGEVLPVLQAIERGEDDAATFERLGRGLETVGAYEYAALAWRCALRLGASGDELVPRLEALLEEFEPGAGVGSGGDR